MSLEFLCGGEGLGLEVVDVLEVVVKDEPVGFERVMVAELSVDYCEVREKSSLYSAIRTHSPRVARHTSCCLILSRPLMRRLLGSTPTRADQCLGQKLLKQLGLMVEEYCYLGVL